MHKYRRNVHVSTQKKKGRIWEMQSLTRHLNFACLVVVLECPFLRCLIDLIRGTTNILFALPFKQGRHGCMVTIYWHFKWKISYITGKLGIIRHDQTVGLKVWSFLLANHCIIFFYNNIHVVDVINRLSARDKNLLVLVRRLTISTMRFNTVELEFFMTWNFYEFPQNGILRRLIFTN